MPDTNVTPLDRAIQLAAMHHAGQKDKGGQPYILHPIRVMSRLSSETDMLAGILHDTIEDTACTVEELLQAGIPEQVVEAVQVLTHDKKVESTGHYLERVAANPIAKRVKLSDLQDNMNVLRLEHVNEKSRERLNKYLHAWRFLTEGTPLPDQYYRDRK